MTKMHTDTFSPKKTRTEAALSSSEQQIEDFLSYQNSLRIRQSIFTACFLLLCLIDQLLGSAPEQLHGILIKSMGLVTAVVTLNCSSGTGKKSYFLYIPYLLWILFFLTVVRHQALQTFGPEILNPFGWLTGYGKNSLAGSTELAEWIILVCSIGIYGIVILRTIMRYVFSQRIPRINWPFSIIWAAMLLGMFLSANKAVWPLCFIILFGCYYLTEYSSDEFHCLVNGMMNGIISAFFLFLVFSCMFRAFDTSGYCGMYVQYEKNALFYLFAHAAFLGKWLQFHRNGASRVWRVLAALCVCFATGFGVITTVRLVILLMLFNTLITVLVISLSENRARIWKALLRLAAVLSLSAAMVPCAYWLARSTPFYFTSPLIYSTETYENKVPFHAPLDETRYTDPDEFLEELTGQLFQYSDPDKQELKETMELLRADTLKAYFQELNLSGHPSDESGFWISDWYYVSHANNIFLHVSYTYGIPVGLIFLTLCIVAVLFFLLRFQKLRTMDWPYFTCALFLITVLSYGSFEQDWSVGQLPFTMLFFVLYPVMHRTVSPKNNPYVIQERRDSHE